MTEGGRMRKVPMILILSSTAVLMIGFQNCSNSANFTSSDALIGGKTVVAMTDSTDSTPADGNGGGAPPTTYPPVVIDPPTTYPPVAVVPPTTRPPSDYDDSDDDDDSYDDSRDSDHDSEKGRNFVCVIDGNGKSVTLALVSATLQGKVGTPRDVCMTEKACLEIVSKSFEVKGAERRGFCPDKNPNVVSMSDLEIEAALVHADIVRRTANN
jgi:hypothetical protein